MMRRAVLLIVFAACDLQPPPPKVQPASPAPAAEPSATCLDAATNFANVLIAGTTDQTQRASLEQDRARLVKRTADACAAKWSDSARACYATAKDVKDLEACGKLVAQTRG